MDPHRRQLECENFFVAHAVTRETNKLDCIYSRECIPSDDTTMGLVSNQVLLRAGLAPLATVRSREHAMQQGMDSLLFVKEQRDKIMDMVQSARPGMAAKHNIIDFGGPYDGGTGEHWARINQSYLCEYVIVSLVNGTLKKTTNTYTPISTDIAIGFPVVGLSDSVDPLTLHDFFTMTGGHSNQSAALMVLLGHAVAQVDASILCNPIQDLVAFTDEVLVPTYTTTQPERENILGDPIAIGGAGITYHQAPVNNDDDECNIGSLWMPQTADNVNLSSTTTMNGFSCCNPWEPMHTNTIFNGTPMSQFATSFFSTNNDSGGKPTHLSHEIRLIRSKEDNMVKKKTSVWSKRKMVSIHHTMAPINPNHCLATLVLHDKATGEAYTHVAVLDLGHGKKSHTNLLSSFCALSKSCLSAGSPGSNPFHMPQTRIQKVTMKGYDFAHVSNPLSFFWTPTMQVHMIGSSSTTPVREFEVGMSVHTLRHLPDDTDVVLGSPLAIPSSSSLSDWMQERLKDHVKTGRYPNLGQAMIVGTKGPWDKVEEVYERFVGYIAECRKEPNILHKGVEFEHRSLNFKETTRLKNLFLDLNFFDGTYLDPRYIDGTGLDPTRPERCMLFSREKRLLKEDKFLLVMLKNDWMMILEQPSFKDFMTVVARNINLWKKEQVLDVSFPDYHCFNDQEMTDLKDYMIKTFGLIHPTDPPDSDETLIKPFGGLRPLQFHLVLPKGKSLHRFRTTLQFTIEGNVLNLSD